MKFTVLLAFLSVLTSCSVKNSAGHNDLSPAAADVYKKIITAEKDIAKFEDDGWGYADVEEIVYLSGIDAMGGYGDWAGFHYKVSKSNIAEWKAWFEKNREYLSYDDDNEYCKILKDLKIKLKIIVLRLPNGTIRNSMGGQDVVLLEQWINRNK